MSHVGARGPGPRVLICPECLALIDNAGRGRAHCLGQSREHDQTEMVAYVPEERTPTPYSCSRCGIEHLTLQGAISCCPRTRPAKSRNEPPT